MTNVLVVGAGPAGVAAALRAADLGAQTTLVTSAEFGGMAANDGPVPVRALFRLPTILHPLATANSILVRRDNPLQMTLLPGGPSLALAR